MACISGDDGVRLEDTETSPPLHLSLSQCIRAKRVSIMASATPSASVPGKSTSAPEERGAGGLRRHTEWPKVAAAVITAAMRSSLPHLRANDHACTRTHCKSCSPSPSVTNVRNMLESCDNRARREKRHGEMFRRHAEWPQVADAVIDAGCARPINSIDILLGLEPFLLSLGIEARHHGTFLARLAFTLIRLTAFGFHRCPSLPAAASHDRAPG
jgi:hypothetical protein